MLLILAFICLAGALTLVGQVLTAAAARVGVATPGAGVRATAGQLAGRPGLRELSARYGERFARVAMKVDPRATEERVGLKLVAAGLARTFSPTEFLAAKVVLARRGRSWAA